MTRINVVDVSQLSDQHLGAEYHELPRVFGLVRDAVKRGEKPDDPRNPKHYVLGTGHVRFFYPRLGFLVERYQAICNECRNRGRLVRFGDVTALTQDIPEEWFQSWTPDAAAIALSTARIKEQNRKYVLKLLGVELGA